MLTLNYHSSNTLTRKESIQKISIISNWRFQLLSLTYLSDRTRRHPFKLARPPFSFVATDVGETNYIPDEDDEGAAVLAGSAAGAVAALSTLVVAAGCALDATAVEPPETTRP